MFSYQHPGTSVERGMTVQGVTGLCDEGLAEAERLRSTIASLAEAKEEALTWEATFGAFDRISVALQEAASVPGLFTLVHPDPQVREAAMACEPRVDAFVSALYLDEAVAQTLTGAAKVLGTRSTAQQKFVEEVLRDYRRNGLSLSQEQRARLLVLNEALTKEAQDFEKNLAESTLAMEIPPSSLAGLPPEYVANHPVQPNGMVRLTTDPPDYTPFLRYAEDRAAARELYRLAHTRAREANKAILERVLRLREEKAKLLGYPTWAAFVLETRMAKHPGNVRAFLDRLHTGLAPRRAIEAALFAEEAARVGCVLPDGRVSVADALFLDTRIRQSRFALDSQALSAYFEIRAVQAGIMDIASALYGITCTRLEVPTWHADVEAFDLTDTRTGELLGRAYLDLFPREGKFKHAAMFTLRNTFTQDDGSRVVPAAALVCNFPKPGVAPALLDHDQVTTFFHEFGHLLHDLLSRAALNSQAGTRVARDFVEVPSQLFEEWAWTRETLDVFARHHQTGERLPESLFQPLVASRTFGEALFTDRQLFLARLDQEYHTRPSGFDPSAVVEELHAEYSPFARVPDTCFEATFGHLMGYDAAYYGYQWALSLAFDVHTRFKKEGLMRAETAQAYRAAILEAGGSDDESVLIERFLGRPANEQAYLAYLGITSTG